LDLDAPGVNTAMLSFVTDQGAGTASVPLWGQGRTAAVDVSGLPQWSGTLRMLSISLPDAGSHEVTLRGVWVGKLPLGRPYVYLRSFAPGRAIQRAGREERLLAVARNLGATARNVTAAVSVPPGVELLSPAEQTLPDLLPDATALVEWRIRAAGPVTGAAQATISADGQRRQSRDWRLDIQPAATAPRADYVPVPVPVPPRGVMTLMHYCPLWKEGTHYGWEKIEPWPERRPAIGWYDEGSPEVADWHIKYAVEHGVQGFIYCWYRRDLKPEITHFIGHALDDGLLHARYLPYFKFAINWENANAAGVKDRADLLDNLLPYWIEKYFKNPSYAKIDNKPILYVLTPRPFTQQLGGHAQVREALDAMRARCRDAGFAGLIVICGVESADAAFLKQTREEGYDATGAYGCWGPTKVPNQRDVEGVITVDYPSSVLGQEQIWRGKKRIDELPDVIDVMMGWDPRPWHGPTTQSYIAPASPAA
ncbi:MAG: glycoside hydrolase family 99-like domain-containing protein, partial [Armatimonadetes bacterium]|nr:glycoside hydrolase family 99-like domain-containing protein [Armatimonadota bacterium]